MKIKDIPTFEQVKNLKNIFELSSNDKTLSPNYINKNYFDEQIDLLLYANHFRLIAILLSFCKSNNNSTHVCKRCLHTCRVKNQLENH